jgi:hypothetical protein
MRSLIATAIVAVAVAVARRGTIVGLFGSVNVGYGGNMFGSGGDAVTQYRPRVRRVRRVKLPDTADADNGVDMKVPSDVFEDKTQPTLLTASAARQWQALHRWTDGIDGDGSKGAAYLAKHD